MLGVLITLLLTPAFARWMYYEFGTAEGTQIEHPVHLGEFNYVVTLPGDPGTKPPVVTTPTPDTDTSNPDTTTTTTTTTTDPGGSDTPEEDFDGKNHYNMVNMVFEDLQGFLALGLKEEFFDDISINGEGMLHDAIFGKLNPMHSVATNFAGGKLSTILDAADADELAFVLVYDKTKGEVIMYSFNNPNIAGNEGNTVTVYQSFAYYNTTTEHWEIDASKTTVGTAPVQKAPTGNKKTIDYTKYQITQSVANT